MVALHVVAEEINYFATYFPVNDKIDFLIYNIAIEWNWHDRATKRNPV